MVLVRVDRHLRSTIASPTSLSSPQALTRPFESENSYRAREIPFSHSGDVFRVFHRISRHVYNLGFCSRLREPRKSRFAMHGKLAVDRFAGENGISFRSCGKP